MCNINSTLGCSQYVITLVYYGERSNDCNNNHEFKNDLKVNFLLFVIIINGTWRWYLVGGDVCWPKFLSLSTGWVWNVWATLISCPCSSIFSSEAVQHWKNLNCTVNVKTILKGTNKMDEIRVSQDREYREFFTSDPILKITMIFSIYLQNTSSRKFMHVENKREPGLC